MADIKIAGIMRAGAFSPNHIGNDSTIFNIVADQLRKRGCEVSVYSEEQFISSGVREDIVVNMCREPRSIRLLQQLEDNGALVINSGYGIENCVRERMARILLGSNIPYPESIIVSTDEAIRDTLTKARISRCWIKRGDSHTMHNEDVTYVRHPEEAQEILQEYFLRGIKRAVINRHIEGEQIKFYGIVGTPFFYWLSAKDSSAEHRPASKRNSAPDFNEEKLKAAIQLVDFLYSDDGQIVSTFGPMASDAEGTGGFWYNDIATSADVAAGEYFTYKGVKYAGTYYKGNYTPTITDNLYKSFKGLPVHGWKLADNKTASGGTLSFTTYARTLIGSTLPVGVKDQSFENQLTSKMGQVGAGKVGTGLALGTIKGMTLDIKADTYWYTVVPTSLPVSSDKVTNVLEAASQSHLKKITGTGSGKDFFSIMNWIILNGFTKDYNQQDEAVKIVK